MSNLADKANPTEMHNKALEELKNLEAETKPENVTENVKEPAKLEIEDDVSAPFIKEEPVKVQSEPEQPERTTTSKRVFKYKRDGKEFELDASTPEGEQKILEALSLAKENRKERSEVGKYKKQLDKLTKDMGNYKDAQEFVNELKKHKDNPAKIAEMAFGKEGWTDYKKRELERQKLRETADETELFMMDREEELNTKKYTLQQKEDEINRLRGEFRDYQVKNEAEQLRNTMLPYFKKYAQFEGVTEERAKSLAGRMWKSVVADLKDLKNNDVDITPGVIGKLFKLQKDDLDAYANRNVKSKVKEIVDNQSNDATAAAQAAAKRNYPKKSVKESELKGKDALEILNFLTKQ